MSMNDKEKEFVYQLEKELGEKKYKKLIKLVAKFTEKAYRRGAQQALVMGGENENNVNCILPKYLKDNLYSWRYRTPITKSIGLDGLVTPSLKRLEWEGWHHGFE